MSTDIIARGMASGAQAAVAKGAVATTGGAQTINTPSAFLEVMGALTSDTTLTLATSTTQVIKNSTTGAYKLWVKRGASGVPLMIPQNEQIEVR